MSDIEQKDHPATVETDGDFFDQMRQMERDNLTRMGDTEALAWLDEEERRLAQEAEEADRLDAQGAFDPPGVSQS